MEDLKCTHNFAVMSKYEISPKRTVQVSRFSDGSTAIAINTYHDGPDKEPYTTKMRLTPIALELLSGALFEAAHNIDKWKIKTPPQPEPAPARSKRGF